MWNQGNTVSNLTISTSLGSNRQLMMQNSGIYNQSQFSPVCITKPYLLSEDGNDTISIQGVNFGGLRQNIDALGPYFDTNGLQGTVKPDRNSYMEEISCVFQGPGTFSQCETTNGYKIPGTSCTMDMQCQGFKVDEDTGVTSGLHLSQFACNAVIRNVATSM